MASSNQGAARFFYGYVIVFVAFSLQTFGWGISNSLSVFFKSFDSDFGWSRAVISSALSFSLLVAGLVGILQGRLNDMILSGFYSLRWVPMFQFLARLANSLTSSMFLKSSSPQSS